MRDYKNALNKIRASHLYNRMAQIYFDFIIPIKIIAPQLYMNCYDTLIYEHRHRNWYSLEGVVQ